MQRLSLEPNQSNTSPSPSTSSTPSSTSQAESKHYYSFETMSLTLVEAALNSKMDGETMKGVREVLKKNAPSKTRIAFVYQRDADLVDSNINNNNGNGTVSFK